jgi:hypothetical protein
MMLLRFAFFFMLYLYLSFLCFSFLVDFLSYSMEWNSLDDWAVLTFSILLCSLSL